VSTGPFQPRSVASLFQPGVDPRTNPAWGALVQNGMDPETPVHLLGWVDDQNRHALAATFAPPLAQAAPQLMGADENVLLYKAWKLVLGDYPKYRRQEIGDCTSFGSGHAVDLLQCIEQVMLNEPTGYLETCTEAIYGMGREIAGMLGGGDGCYGVAVAKALVEHGAVPRKLVGEYSGQLAKQWGARGVPPEIKAEMARYRMGSAAIITTLEELDAALANLYPAAGGFSQGFTMQRDQDGACRQSGRWGHETFIAGRRRRNGRRQYCMCQSWGPNVPSGPTTDDQPDFSFWIDEDPMANILGQRDFLTFSKAPDFVQRDVPSAFRYTGGVG
jgi:hypothetical protein